MSTSTETEPAHQGKVKHIFAKFRGHHGRPSNNPEKQGHNIKCLHIHRSRRPSQQEIAGQISLEIWNAAYHALKNDAGCAQLVHAYEAIVIQELPNEQKVGINEIPSDQRLEFMTAIASSALGKDFSSKSSEVDDSAREILIYLREAIDSCREVYPSAAIAWAGFCILTPLLLDPLLQQEAFKDTLLYVTNHISHFMSLYAILLRENWSTEQEFQRLQVHSRQTLLELYRKILEFEMNCVCAAASSWNFAAKNVVDWNGWSGMHEKIQSKDEDVRRDVEKYGTNDVRERCSCEDDDDDDGVVKGV